MNEICFKTYRDKLKQAILNSQKAFYAEKIKRCSGNIKQMWEIFNKLISKEKERAESIHVLIDGRSVTDVKLIVEKFNKSLTREG